MRCLAITAATVLAAAILGIGCDPSEAEMIPEPFASLIPSCADIPMDLDWENEHAKEGDEFNPSHLIYERQCEGEDTQSIQMAIREFENEADVSRYATSVPEARPGTLVLDVKDDVTPSFALDDFEAYSYHFMLEVTDDGNALVPAEDEGSADTTIQFRRGRFVGTYTVFARGEIARDASNEPFFVLADIPPELVERLMNDTLARWSLP